MLKDKIILPQKKIIIIGIFLILASGLFRVFIYLPSQNYIAKLRSEVLNLESQIQEIEVILSKAKTVEGAAELIRKRYQELNSKFPHEEKESLEMLAHLAKRLNIGTVSIKPQPKKVFLDEDNKRVEIDGKICQMVPVTIQMNCFYKDLIKYIGSLKRDLPAFIMIEKLIINMDKVVKTRLNIILDLNLYLAF